MGKYHYLMAGFTLLVVVANFGISENITKMHMENAVYPKLYTYIIGFRLFLSIMLAIVGYFTLISSNLFFCLAIVLSSFSLGVQNHESKGGGREVFKVNMLTVSLGTLMKLYCAYISPDLETLSVIFLVETAVYNLVLFISGLNNIKQSNYEIGKTGIKDVVLNKKFIFVWISGVLGTVSSKFDIYIIGFFSSSLDLGYYTYSVKIVSFGVLLPSLIVSSLMAYFVNLESDGRIRIYSMFFWVCSGLSLLIIISNVIIVNTYLTDYKDTIFLVSLLSLRVPFLILRVLTGKFLICSNRTKFIFYRAILSFFVSVISLLLGYYLAGIKGVCFAALFTSIFSGVILDFMFNDTKDIFKEKMLAIKLMR